MPVITTASFPKALVPGLRGIWGREYSEHPKEYTDLFNEVSSDKSYEEYVGTSSFGVGRVKSEGGSISFDTEQQGYIARLTNVTYALGYIVTMEEMQDNKYESLAKSRTRMLSFSYRQMMEQIGALVYNRAVTSGYNGADGVVLGSTAHPNVSGGTWANRPTTGSALSEASLEDAMIAIMGLQNDRGLFVSIMPKSLHIARQEVFNAHRILKSIQQSGTANNDVNALRAMNVLPEGVKLNHYFTTAGMWFVRTTVGGGGNGMMFQNRMPVAFDQENDWDTKNFKAAFITRFTFGWDDPRAIWVNPGP